MRIYCDLDGVLAPLTLPQQPIKVPAPYIGAWYLDQSHCELLNSWVNDPEIDFVWITSWEEDVRILEKALGLRTSPFIEFTDPTGAKVNDIITHLKTHPTDHALVIDDELTEADIHHLEATGLKVYSPDPHQGILTHQLPHF